MSCFTSSVYITVTDPRGGDPMVEKVMLDAFDVWVRQGDTWQPLGDPSELEGGGHVEVRVVAKGGDVDTDESLAGVLDPDARGGRDNTISEDAPSGNLAAAVRLCALANSGDRGAAQVTTDLVLSAIGGTTLRYDLPGGAKRVVNSMTAAQLRVAMSVPLVRQVFADPGADPADLERLAKALATHPAKGQLLGWAHERDRQLVELFVRTKQDPEALAAVLQGADVVTRMATKWCPDRVALAKAGELVLPNAGTERLDVEHTQGAGMPALWESGGALTSSGSARVVARPDGSRPYCALQRTRGHLAGGDHALVPVAAGFYVIEAGQNRNGSKVTIRRITQTSGTDLDGKNFHVEAQASVVGSWSGDDWRTGVPPFLHGAVAAAFNKAGTYHARHAVWVTDERPDDALARPKGSARGDRETRARRYKEQVAKAAAALDDAQRRLDGVPGAPAVGSVGERGLFLGSQAGAVSDERIAKVGEQVDQVLETWAATQARREVLDELAARAEAVGITATLRYDGLVAIIGNHTVTAKPGLEEHFTERLEQAEREAAEREANRGELDALSQRAQAVGVDVPSSATDQQLEQLAERVAAGEELRRQEEANAPALEALASRAASLGVTVPASATDRQLDEFTDRLERSEARAVAQEAQARRQAHLDEVGQVPAVETLSRSGQDMHWVLVVDGDGTEVEGEAIRYSKERRYAGVATDDAAVVVTASTYDETAVLRADRDFGTTPAWTPEQVDAVLDRVAGFRTSERRLVPVVVADELVDALSDAAYARDDADDVLRFAAMPTSRREVVLDAVRKMAPGADGGFEDLARGVPLPESVQLSGEVHGTVNYDGREADVVWGPFDLGDSVAVGLNYYKYGGEQYTLVLAPPSRIPGAGVSGSGVESDASDEGPASADALAALAEKFSGDK